MASKKYKITQLQNDSTLLELHPATDADIVSVETGTGKYQGTATNVQDALEEVYDMAATGGVTGVKGDAESTYRTGNVNLTPDNIGAEAAFTDGSATIASVASDIVTIKGGVKQNAGAILNKTTTEAADIVLAKVAKTGSYNDLSNKPTLGTAAACNTGTSSGNVPVLDSNGKLVASVIPAVAITDTFTAASQADMLALSAQKGDICIRTDISKTFILTADGASTLANWKELATPTDSVTSVNGKTGAVVLSAADIGNSSTYFIGSDDVNVALDDICDRILSVEDGSIPVAKSLALVDGTTKVGLSVGSSTKPVYFSSGVPTAGSDYAGGTKVTLNGADKGASTASFYAPTGAGTSGQILKSSGTGAPSWVNQSTLSVGSATDFSSAKTIALTGDITGSASGGTSGSGWSVATTLKNSGVTAGTYSAVTVNAKGIVTAGAQMLEVGTTGQTTPSASLAVGGIFFQEI